MFTVPHQYCTASVPESDIWYHHSVHCRVSVTLIHFQEYPSGIQFLHFSKITWPIMLLCTDFFPAIWYWVPCFSRICF